MKKLITLIILAAFTFTSSCLCAQAFYTGAAQPEGYTIQKYAPENGSRDFPGCLGCSLQEGEADIPDDGTDVVNGGCNNATPIFTDIQIGDVFCGRGNGYMVGGFSYRDTDWYRIVLTESKTLYWSGIANFNCVFYIFDGICGAPSIIASTTPALGTVGTASATIGPGTYVFFAAPAVFWPIPGNTGDYMVTLTELAPGDPDSWCTSVPISNWALFIGIGLILIAAVIRFRRLI